MACFLLEIPSNRIVRFICDVLLHKWKLSYTDGHPFVPDWEFPSGIQGEKLSLKEIFAKFFQIKSSSLESAPFPGALLLFSAGKKSLGRPSSQNHVKI